MTSVRNIAVAAATAESGVADTGPRAGEAAAPDPAPVTTPAGDAGSEARTRSGAVRRRALGGPVGVRRAVGPVIGEQLAALLLQNHQPDVLLSDQCACGQPFPCPSRVFGTAFFGDEESLTPPARTPNDAPPAVNAAPAAEAAPATSAPPAAAAASAPPAVDAGSAVGAGSEPAATERAATRGTPRHGAGDAGRSGGRQGSRRRAAHRAESSDAAPEAARKRPAADEDPDRTQVLERIDPNAEPPAEAQPQSGADLDATQELQKIPQDPSVAIAV